MQYAKLLQTGIAALVGTAYHMPTLTLTQLCIVSATQWVVLNWHSVTWEANATSQVTINLNANTKPTSNPNLNKLPTSNMPL